MSSSTQSHPSRGVIVIAVGVAVLSGALVAVQTRINSQFARDLGDSFLAALVSFVVGGVIVAAVALLAPSGRRGIARLRDSVASRETPWWFLLGGACGAFFVVAQGLTGAILGVSLFTIATVATQTVAGAIIDGVGFGDMLKRPVTVLRIIASILALGAVAFTGLAELRTDFPVALLIFPLVAGAAAGYQQAANGQLRHVAQSTLAATLVNFVVGTVALLLATAVHVVAGGWVAAFPTELWLYSGGLIGILLIAGSIVVVRAIGVLLLSLGLIAGQLLGALLLDVFFPMAIGGLPVTTVIGTLVTLGAVSLAAVSAQRSDAPVVGLRADD